MAESASQLPPEMDSSHREVRGRIVGELRSQGPTILAYERVLDDVLRYSDQSMRVEIGGFLLGKLHESPEWCCEIRGFTAAEHTRSTAGSLTFTHETWATLNRYLDQRGQGDKVLGWHHTHPGLGVFLSGYDEFIHRHFFSQPWQLAMVVDPVKQEFGFFQWNADRIVDCGFVWAPGDAN